MEEKFNTSFIPKQSLQAGVGNASDDKYVTRRTTYGPGFYSTLLLFIVALVTSLGLFGYITVVENTVQKKVQILKEKKGLFSEESISALIHESNYIEQTKKLLNTHVTVSELFDEIERLTLRNVQYVGMVYTDKAGADPEFTLSGKTKSYQDVAVQTTEYEESGVIHTPIVEDLGRLNLGPVHFTIKLFTDPSLVSYTEALRTGRLDSQPVQATPPIEAVNNEPEDNTQEAEPAPSPQT
jgi:hypothetical protein